MNEIGGQGLKIVMSLFVLPDQAGPGSYQPSEMLFGFNNKLVQRFNENAKKADAMKHSFENEMGWDVRIYMTQKHMLYAQAGENNQKYMHGGQTLR